MSSKCLLILSVEMFLLFIFMDLPMAKLIKFTEMAGVMLKADHASLLRTPGDCINFYPLIVIVEF